MTRPAEHSIPLFPEGSPERALLLDGETTWRVADVLATARDLQASLSALPGPVRYLVNLTRRRDRFLVGLLAGILGDRVTLMPANRTRGTVEDLLDEHPDAVILHEADDPPDATLAARASHVEVPELHRATSEPRGSIPAIPADRHVARVYTSGTTGRPRGHDKHWGRLVANVHAASEALAADSGTAGRSGPMHLLGTVPSQHMYGFESLILATVCGSAALSTEQPFFPQDISRALARVPSPRTLVTTPYHLHHLLASGCHLPTCERILCATAPLDPELARRAEAATGGILQEIYGSTETGQIAVRRPTRDDGWRLMKGVRLTDDGQGEVIASGGHVERPVPIADCIERRDNGRFRLVGRRANQVNIAGKRSSLEFLNTTLRAIDGVTDGVFFRPRPGRPAGDGQPERLAAVVCAPELSPEAIRRALRSRLDPAFLPRPLLFVEQMPVNATGKVTREALDNLLADRQAEQRNG
ncbi:MAG: AMP-binding protein [Pseudomonadota bacterium]